MLTVTDRLALVLFALLLAATVLFGFLTMKADSVNFDCGSAFLSNVSKDDVSAARKIGSNIQDGTYDLLGEDTKADAAATAVGTIECSDKVSDRRVLVIGLGVGSLLVPAAIVFIGAGVRRRT